MNDASVGLNLKDAQAASSREFRVVETAPPVRPLSTRPPRKPKKNAEKVEPKAPRVQLWGEMRVLRCREIETAESDTENGAAIFETTCAREEAVSPSFAQAFAQALPVPSVDSSFISSVDLSAA